MLSLPKEMEPMAFLSQTVSPVCSLPVLLIVLIRPAAPGAPRLRTSPRLPSSPNITTSPRPSILWPIDLSAVAKVDFRATEVSSIVRVELHPNLNVSEIKSSAGKTL